MNPLVNPLLRTLLGTLVLLSAAAFAQQDTAEAGATRSYDFVKLDPGTTDPNGNSILANCGADHPDARAGMDVRQSFGTTDVTITVADARPDTLFTVWLWLGGTDPQGEAFGGNPVSGKSGAPFAPSTAYEELLAATGPGNGVTEGANVFTTDAQGNAVFTTTLDFPLFGGAYPFHRITGFDPDDPRLPIADARRYPVALVSSGESYEAPFLIRIASHCTDGLSHGWLAGPREPWFDYPE